MFNHIIGENKIVGSISKADVVIAGGGISGIVAALELLDSGLRVVILDRDEESKFGGLAKESFGAMFFVDTPQQRLSGIRDSADLALKDWISYAEFGENDIWPRRWAEFYVNRCTDLGYKWLRKQGVKFLPVVNWVERGLPGHPGNTVPRFHIVWGSGQGLYEVLEKRLRTHPNSHQLQILFRHTVTDIIKKDGRIIGLAGKNEVSGEEFSIDADNTIIASGGICGSIERVKENWYKPWGEPPETILNGSHRYADGRLHDAAEIIGANVTHMDKLWLYAGGVKHPNPRIPHHGLSIIPFKSAIWLNSEGRRFGPEPLLGGFDARYLIEKICQQNHKYSWQVLNLKIANRELAISGSEHNPALRDKNVVKFLKGSLFGAKGLVQEMLSTCENFVTANSVEELAEKMQQNSDNGVQIDTQGLRDAIQEFDATADSEASKSDRQRQLIRQLRKYPIELMRTCSANQKINDPSAMPLIAVKEYILSRKTLGGIQTDLQSRVLTETGDPIPGLYAIGEAAGFGGGGVHGKRSLEGTFLGGCIISSRASAKSIMGTKF